MTNERKSLVRKVGDVVESDPVMVRGFIVSVFGVVAMIFNVSFASGVVEAVANSVISVLALVAAIWTRPKVTPNSKVAIWVPSPKENPGHVVPGQASLSMNAKFVEDKGTADNV